MWLYGKAKWTGNLVQAKRILPVLFALLVLSTSYYKQQPPCKQNEKGWKQQWSQICLSPALAVAPQEQMCEAALAFASRRAVGLGKTRTIHLLLTVETPLELKGTLTVSTPCSSVSRPHTGHTRPWRKWTQTQIIGFRDGFSCLQKHFKFPCINTKVAFES